MVIPINPPRPIAGQRERRGEAEEGKERKKGGATPPRRALAGGGENGDGGRGVGGT